jgi:predicted component of type VI protein secretion system
MADEGFQALHSTWAGLKYLVDAVAENPNVKVKVLDVSKRELLRNLQRPPAFDQSLLFRFVVSEGVGTFGGEAFGCLIGDYYLTGTPNDVELAEKVSKTAAAAGAPFLCAARPGLLGATGWKEITAGFSPYSKPGAPLSAWWQRSPEWPDGWATFLFLPRVRPFGAPPEASGPWSSDYALLRRTRTWLNPTFFVGMVVADAFRGHSLTDVAQRLFPPWPQWKDTTPDKFSSAPEASAEGSSEPSHDESESLDLEYEWDFPAEVAIHLAEFGLNVLSESKEGRQGLVLLR